jgi:hypothetical protein
MDTNLNLVRAMLNARAAANLKVKAPNAEAKPKTLTWTLGPKPGDPNDLFYIGSLEWEADVLAFWKREVTGRKGETRSTYLVDVRGLHCCGTADATKAERNLHCPACRLNWLRQQGRPMQSVRVVVLRSPSRPDRIGVRRPKLWSVLHLTQRAFRLLTYLC